MILRPRFGRRAGTASQPERLCWRDWYQVCTRVLGLVLGVVIAVRAVHEHAYIALIAAAAFIGWGGVGLLYIYSYFRRRSAER